MSTPFQLYPFLSKRFGQTNIHIIDGESADMAEDYRVIIEDLLTLTKMQIVLSDFECTEADPRVLQPTLSGIPLTFTVEGDTDWVDAEALVVGLNRYFEQKGLEYRFYTFYDAVQFGQETGFCFAEKSQGDALLAELKALRENGEGYFGFFTDGTDGVGLEESVEEDDEDWEEEYDDEEDWDEEEDEADEEDDEEDDEEEEDEDDDDEEDDDEEDDDWDDDDEDWEDDRERTPSDGDGEEDVRMR